MVAPFPPRRRTRATTATVNLVTMSTCTWGESTKSRSTTATATVSLAISQQPDRMVEPIIYNPPERDSNHVPIFMSRRNVCPPSDSLGRQNAVVRPSSCTADVIILNMNDNMSICPCWSFSFHFLEKSSRRTSRISLTKVVPDRFILAQLPAPRSALVASPRETEPR